MNRKLSLARLAPLSWMLLLALVLGTGCKGKLDMAKYTGEATALAQKYAPQLQELSGRLPELAKRAGDIPDSVPGASALKGLLAKNKDAVAKLQGMIAGLGAKVAEQAKTGKPDEVKKLLDTSSAELETGVAAVRTDLDAATAELPKVEEAAKAAAPAPAPAPTPDPAAAPAAPPT
jgi:pyruvate dehydrogenase E2 component (dihydrolipoamide acetyltransferase)